MREILNQEINVFLDNRHKILAQVFFLIKQDNAIDIRIADMDEEDQRGLSNDFLDSVKQNIIDSESLQVINLSTDDDRKDVIYKYDLDQKSSTLEEIETLRTKPEIPMFKFGRDKLNSVNGILIIYEYEDKELILYKKNYPINLYKKDFTYTFTKFGNDTRMVKCDKDMLKISPDFDFIEVGNEIYIKNLSTLEKYFGIHDIIIRKANDCIQMIKEWDVLEDSKVLSAIAKDITFARKLTKVAASSPVLGKVPVSEIKIFAEKHPKLMGKFEYNPEITKINLKTKEAQKAFIKLLNDDYLTSELTKQYYDSLSKDRVDITA